MGEERKLGATHASGARQPRGLLGRLKRLLHATVFERMKTDDPQATSGPEHRRGLRQERIELVEFPINENAEGLKTSGGRMLRLARGTGPGKGLTNEVCKFASTGQRRLRAGLCGLLPRDDGTGNRSGLALITKAAQHLGNLGDGRGLKPV